MTMTECISAAIGGITPPAGHGDGVLVSLAVEADEGWIDWDDEGPVERVPLSLRYRVQAGHGSACGVAYLGELRREPGSGDTWRDDPVLRRDVPESVRDVLEGEGVVGIDIAVALIKLAASDSHLLQSP